eukprot:TRINITY_DN6300_c0_g1_i17.p1 TRINITY_DN6300_c0_g1~~TRINITY_DN6300_c0_g1_i17.p1  ORF type:complete len:575 (-),score=93.68 TRINITY_DN6300_c0_g1_i17:344-2068(-)
MWRKIKSNFGIMASSIPTEDGKRLKMAEGVFPIQDLPDDILDILFEYLDMKTKKFLRTVSQWLYDQVTFFDTRFRHWRIEFTDNNHDIQFMHLNKALLKDYQNLKIELALKSCSMDNATKEDVLKKVAPFLHVLKISLAGDEMFLMELPKFDHLTSLELSCSFARGQFGNTDALMHDLITKHSAQLKQLNLDHFQEFIVDSPGCPSLDTLRMHNCGVKPASSIIKHCHTQLKTLELNHSSIDAGILASYPLINLQHLKIHSVSEIFNVFIGQCHNSLTFLSIGNVSHFPAHPLPNLRELKVISWMFDINSALEQCCNSLVKLDIREVRGYPATELSAYQLPKLTYLDLGMDCDPLVRNQLLAKCNKTLNKLIFYNTNDEQLLFTELPQLRHLVGNFNTFVGCQFLKKHAGQLVSLEICDWIQTGKTLIDFPQLNFFWYNGCHPGGNTKQDAKFKTPVLKDLLITGSGLKTSLTNLVQGYEATLEFIAVALPSRFVESCFSQDLPKVEYVLLPKDTSPAVIKKIRAKLPDTAEILTAKSAVQQALRDRAKRQSLYYTQEIADCLIYCMYGGNDTF